MAVGPVEETIRQKWSLTREAFDSLLASIGPNRDAAAAKYLEIRRNLVRIFEWRGCLTPDEYADEAINRCARKISEGQEIRDVPTYCTGIARMLVREMGRDRARAPRPLEEAPPPQTAPSHPGDDSDRRADCLRSCLTQLPPESRKFILNYYQGDKGDKIKNRKGLTELFQIPANTLRMRAMRLREKLQLCSQDCLRGEGGPAL
jgi:DNA-directed RNA polymerase specialized sigma24 family protein